MIRVGQRRVGVVVEAEVRQAVAGRREREVLRPVGQRVLHDRERRLRLRVRERARDVGARDEVDRWRHRCRGRRSPPGVQVRPSRPNPGRPQALGHGVLTGQQVAERLRVGQRRVGVVVELERAERRRRTRSPDPDPPAVRDRVLRDRDRAVSVLVNVHVTLSPEFNVTKIVSARAVVRGVTGQAGDRVARTAASVTENDPGVRSVNVTGSTGSRRCRRRG